MRFLCLIFMYGHHNDDCIHWRYTYQLLETEKCTQLKKDGKTIKVRLFSVNMSFQQQFLPNSLQLIMCYVLKSMRPAGVKTTGVLAVCWNCGGCQWLQSCLNEVWKDGLSIVYTVVSKPASDWLPCSFPTCSGLCSLPCIACVLILYPVRVLHTILISMCWSQREVG